MHVGQKLWYVKNYRPFQASEVEVMKVARKWATLSNGDRIDVVSMEADGRGYGSPGHAWNSKGDYDADVEHRSAWAKFQLAVQYASAPLVSMQKVTEWLAELGCKP